MAFSHEARRGALPGLPSSVNIHSAARLSEPVIPHRLSGRRVELRNVIDGQQIAPSESQDIRSITIIPPGTDSIHIDRLAQGLQDGVYASPLIVAPSEVAERFRSELPKTAVLGADQMTGMLKDEALRRYGVSNHPGETTGGFHLGTLLLDRLVLGRMTRPTQYDQVHIGEGVSASPLGTRAMLARTPDMLYVQSAARSPRTTPPLINFGNAVPDHALTESAIEPSKSVLAKRELLDHMPLSTGDNQDMITLIAAAEWSEALQVPLGQVMETLGENIQVDPLGQEATDYQDLLQIVGEELHAEGVRLIEAKSADLTRLNARLAGHPRLGQVLPSVYTLVREGMVDMDRVKAVEKQLHKATFPGIPPFVSDFVPYHMKNTDIEDDTPATVASRLDQAIQANSIKPDSGVVIVNTAGFQALDGNGTRHREAQFATGVDERGELDDQNQGLFVFNREKRYLEEQEGIAELGREFMRREQVPVILPAFVEETGWDTARAASMIAPDRVILVSPDERTLQEAAGYAHAVDQNEVLKYVDVRKLKELGIIPQGREVPLRGKGMTILLGWFWGMANGLIKPDGYVAHVDTDIINMDNKGVAYQRDDLDSNVRRPYRPLEYMAAALAQMPASHRAIAVQPGKVGPSRKGEVKHPVFQAFANSEDPYLRRVGLGLSRVIWPSPGEAIAAADFYGNTPWQVTTGFDLDRYLAAVCWELGRNGQQGQGVRDVLAQVLVPSDKIENGSVPEKNDWWEVNWATGLIQHALEFYQGLLAEQQARMRFAPVLEHLSPEQRSALPKELTEGLSPALVPNFTLDHIRAFNDRYAGKQERVLASDSPESYRDAQGGIIYSAHQLFKGGGGPNTASYRWNAWYLPSPNDMVEMGIVDLDGIRINVHPVPSHRERPRGRWEQ